MRYKEIKRQVIDCLNKGYVSHEQRNDIDVKNLLAIGQVSLEEVAEIIGRSRGTIILPAFIILIAALQCT